MKTNTETKQPAEARAEPPLPLNQYMTLRAASEQTGVSYDTMNTAHNAHRLQLTRTEATAHTHTLWIHAGDLVDYMCDQAPDGQRWKPRTISIGDLWIRPDFKIRPVDEREVRKLADKYRCGAPLPPVWAMRYDDRLFLIDGFHRLKAHIESEAKTIDVIVLDLPLHFARALAIYGNEHHGRRLKPGELQQLVCDYLRLNPQDASDLTAGVLSQKQLAERICVSQSTVSRALARKPSSSTMDSLRIFKELRPLNPHLNHATSQEDADMVALIFHRALDVVIAAMPAERKKDILRRLSLNASAVCSSMTPVIRDLVQPRRGGARARGNASVAAARGTGAQGEIAP